MRRRWWLLPLIPLVLAHPTIAVMLAALGAAMVAVAVEGAVEIARAASAARRAERESAGQLRLGTDPRGRPVTLSSEQLAAHALILGASGAGKTTTLLTILEQRIADGAPVVAIDLKGSPSFARSLQEAATRAGRPFRLWTPDGPSHWNPLQHGNATVLKDKLMATERFNEPHYQRAAERHLQTALQVLAAAHPERPPVLPEVVAALDSRRMSQLLRGLGGPLADRVHDYLRNLGPDSISAARGFANRLAIITESHTGSFLQSGAGPAIDLDRALAGGEVVLFSLNSSVYGKLAAQLGTLAVQDLVSAAGRRLAHGGGPPAVIALDEFSALGADNVVALLARGREAGISVLLATQELADLDRAARGLRDQVLGNTAVKIAHRQDVPSSAQTISAMAGSERVWEEQSRGTTSGRLGGRRVASGGVQRLVDRELVAPDEIKRLATGEAVVISKLPSASARRVSVRRPGLER